jgi:CYTH domain-containing protein
MHELPKYSIVEIERRWLVDLARCPRFDENASARITDRYISQSLLRLRQIECSSGEVLYKLCRKYKRIGPLAQPIVNIYLSADELSLLSQIPGNVVVKRRHHYAEGAVDIYRLGDGELAVFEVEFKDLSAATAYTPPEFVLEEITDNPSYSGASLATAAMTHGRDLPQIEDRSQAKEICVNLVNLWIKSSSLFRPWRSAIEPPVNPTSGPRGSLVNSLRRAPKRASRVQASSPAFDAARIIAPAEARELGAVTPSGPSVVPFIVGFARRRMELKRQTSKDPDDLIPWDLGVELKRALRKWLRIDVN